MNVVRRFSEMKTSETVYQSQLNLSTYKAIRAIKSLYETEIFEDTELISAHETEENCDIFVPETKQFIV